MRILDVHVHYVGGRGEEAERFVREARDGGIERAVVFAWNDQDGGYPGLEEIGRLAERFGEFVIPFGYVMPGRHDGLKETREAARRGFAGIKLIFPAKPFDDDEYFPIYEAAAKAGMACLFHTGIMVGTARPDEGPYDYQRRWRVSSGYMRPVTLDRIARTFPEMPIIGAHLGSGAWYEEAAEIMRWNGNVYFDLSIGQMHYVRKDARPGEEPRAIRPRIRELYETGQLKLEKVVFGSDAMMGKAGASTAWALRTLEFELEGLGATEAEKQAVRWGTAARILRVK